jgi:hypothetical protein
MNIQQTMLDTLVMAAIICVVIILSLIAISIFGKTNGREIKGKPISKGQEFKTTFDGRGLARGAGINPEWERNGIPEDHISLCGEPYKYSETKG